MKTIMTICCMCIVFSIHGQIGGLGFVDISYATIGEEFIDASSEGFANPEVQLNENGIGLGANGKFFFKSFSVGGGGSISFLRSDNDAVKMNVDLGYGTLGYNLVRTEELLVNASARIGGFSNTINVTTNTENVFDFGGVIVNDEANFVSGAFMYGAEVDVIYFIEQVPGLALGIGAYFNAPLSLLTWKESTGRVLDIDQGEYTHFGISLKIGGGGFTY